MKNSLQKLRDQYLEDPENPVLGPALKALFVAGLWQTGGRITTIMMNLKTAFAAIFFVFQLMKLYIVRNDMSLVSETFFTVGLCAVDIYKAIAFIYQQSKWRSLIKGVAAEELYEQRYSNKLTRQITKDYTTYARITFFGSGVLVLLAMIFTIANPFLLLMIHLDEYNESDEPYPQILSVLNPFSDARPPGYVIAIIIQVLIITYQSSIIFAFDLNVIALMTFFKGHLAILKVKCSMIFVVEDGGELTSDVIRERIKECHRHFNSLVLLKTSYNSLLSPIMFFYALISSATICCSVLQFSSEQKNSLPQQLFLVSYTFCVIFQLFVYCWHCTDVTDASEQLDRGVYEGDWWRANVRSRRDLLLLGGQLSKSFLFNAGPLAYISVATFVSILRLTYSFYTFMSNK